MGERSDGGARIIHCCARERFGDVRAFFANNGNGSGGNGVGDKSMAVNVNAIDGDKTRARAAFARVGLDVGNLRIAAAMFRCDTGLGQEFGKPHLFSQAKGCFAASTGKPALQVRCDAS